MAPNQPALNMQDDHSPGASNQARESGVPTGGDFGMLQRSYKAGGVLPDYADGDGGTIPGKVGSGGQS